MSFDLPLMLRVLAKSVFSHRETGGRLTVRRVLFLLFFPIWFGLLELVTWVCFLLDEIFFPKYRSVEVNKPVFIVGYPRSGTTHLHRLLYSDTAQFTSLRMWEITFAPSILQKKFFLLLGKMDQMVGKPLYRLAVRAQDRLFSGARSMHGMNVFAAEEDEVILIHVFSSIFVSFLFNFKEIDKFARFDSDVDPKRRKKIMHFYKRCIQRHLYVFGRNKRFLSKNPAFSGKIQSIYETFPDARMVCMVRHPFEAIPSAVSWLSYIYNRFDSIPQSVLTPQILSSTAHFYTYPLEVLDKRPADSQAIAKYDDLVSDPAFFVKGIYDRFGYELSGDYGDYLMQQTEKAKAYESGHSYSLGQYGLSEEQIVKNFQPIFERFGFLTADT